MYLEVDEPFMDLAIEEAQKAQEAGEVPVGAVIVSNGVVIARGFNQPIRLHDATAHAEIAVIREACLRQANCLSSRPCCPMQTRCAAQLDSRINAV